MKLTYEQSAKRELDVLVAFEHVTGLPLTEHLGRNEIDYPTKLTFDAFFALPLDKVLILLYHSLCQGIAAGMEYLHCKKACSHFS